MLQKIWQSQAERFAPLKRRFEKIEPGVTWVIEASAFLTIALLINGYSRANPEWVTLVGNANDPTSDSIELGADPMGLGSIESVQLRINRARIVEGAKGVAYRSVRGTIHVDCARGEAHYLHAVYYKEPNFGGTPVTGRSFEDKPGDAPLRLLGFDSDAVRKVIKTSCKRYGVPTPVSMSYPVASA